MDFTSDFETAIDVATQISLAKENVLGLITNLTLLNLLVTSLMEERNFPKTKTIFEEEYDYVISKYEYLVLTIAYETISLAEKPVKC